MLDFQHKWLPGRSQARELVTSISSGHKTRNPTGIIPQVSLPSATLGEPPWFLSTHRWSGKFCIYSSISVHFICQIWRSRSSSALRASSALFMLQPENHQPVVVGLSHPSGDASPGGSRSKDGHGHGKSRKEKRPEKIHATAYFSILLWLALCL